MTSVADRASRFLAYFNEGDLEGALASFAPDGEFLDATGAAHTGAPALRAALTPLFDGSRGTFNYETTEMFVEEATGRALVTWILTITPKNGAAAKVRGLDILRFAEDGVKSKNAFCKARELLVE
jgi:ketosteroid isomerase-like protein